MISKRLNWYLETNGLITNLQCGFRNKRGITDNLIRLETFIIKAFIKKENATAIFFDLEKAYDTTWKHGIMKDLHSPGLRGSLPKTDKKTSCQVEILEFEWNLLFPTSKTRRK